ncbi:hypothetical protein ACJIZ3_024973 [Penstemon smallii]|uniref:Uncharacterized protein n=1 Tax=Penstemon smallii TaxID=265156 RepID=A0ABD3TVZ5_9LAMI
MERRYGPNNFHALYILSYILLPYQSHQDLFVLIKENFRIDGQKMVGFSRTSGSQKDLSLSCE